jgi:hypothetical protein
MDKEKEYLCFINKIGDDMDGNFTYEFLFTEDPDTFWGEDFDVKPCGLCNNILPKEDGCNLNIPIVTHLKLDLVQNNCCYSYQDCMDDIVAIASENMDDYDEYPIDGRLVLHYGETLQEVSDKLSNKGIKLEC